MQGPLQIPSGPRLASPDESTLGFLVGTPDPARYDSFDPSPYEAGGLILSMIPRGGRVLDVGCGTGRLTAELRRVLGAEVVGLEPDAKRAQMARDRGIEAYEQLLDESTPQHFAPFDAVVFADVLEHLASPAVVLKHAQAMLRPGGVIVASIPNVAHWTVRLDLLRGRFDYATYGIMDATHLRWFTADGVRRLFLAVGMEVERLEMTAGVTLPAYQGRRPWRWMSRRRREGLIRTLTARMPTLFGCQMVVRTRPWYGGPSLGDPEGH